MGTVDFAAYKPLLHALNDPAPLDNFMDALQTLLNGNIDDANIKTAAAIAISKLAGYPANAAKVLLGDGTWGTASGSQLDRATITADTAAISATTEGAAVAVITGNSVTYDGSEVKVEFFAPQIVQSTGMTVTFVLLRDATVLGQWKLAGSASQLNEPVRLDAFDTPAAGAHVYKLSAFVSAGNVVVKADVGGTGKLFPAFLRVTRA